MIKLYRILRRLFDGTGISRVWPLNVLHKWFLNQYNSDMVVVNGLKMYLDKVDTLKLTVKGEYDRYPLQIIEKILKPEDVVLDIGGNIGYYSLMMSKMIGNHGKIFSFEPDEVSFSIFNKNVLENNLKNIKIYQLAATQENEKLKLFINKDNKGDNRIYESQSLNQDSIEIEGRRIDDILSEDTKVNFIKIDIQGSEFGAIKGMGKIIENNPEITIYSEYWPEGMKNFGSDPTTVFHWSPGRR